MKSERLKKLENELKDLKNWLDLDLVPKKDIDKHKSEIEMVEARIAEEKQRLAFLKDNGDVDEYTLPKRNQGKQPYDPQSIPDIGRDTEATDVGSDTESETYEPDHTTLFDIEEGAEEKATAEHEAEDDPYSDANRWKRAKDIADPDSDDNW